MRTVPDLFTDRHKYRTCYNLLKIPDDLKFSLVRLQILSADELNSPSGSRSVKLDHSLESKDYSGNSRRWLNARGPGTRCPQFATMPCVPNRSVTEP